MHSKDGNRVSKKVKTHIKVAQNNKRHSDFKSTKNLMVDLVETNNPDLLCIGEANLNKTDQSSFKDLMTLTSRQNTLRIKKTHD